MSFNFMAAVTICSNFGAPQNNFSDLEKWDELGGGGEVQEGGGCVHQWLIHTVV